ncbi:50S ribosomal protein L23 [Riemerella anatipestifer]|nr:50S ribosomal protein L23 [Riemerella anatipestifer]
MSVIIKPIISEKASNLSDLRGVYSFLVDTKANKIQIKQAVEEAYGVKVADVRTMIYAPKVSAKYTKRTSSWENQQIEKAMVQLVEGEFIDVFATN